MTSDPIVLEAVPNVSEGRDAACISAFARALGAHGCSVLDVHSDADHNRSVFTVLGGPQEIADSLLSAARKVIEHVDMRAHQGAHPCIGALDVVPIVYLRPDERELAHDEALAVANRLAGELDLPVFVYGELATSEERRERSFFRDGGVAALSARLSDGDLAPDFGPPRLHPTAGGALVGARPPLVAFNVELDTDEVEIARSIAAAVRERDGGLPGVRAIGVKLGTRGVTQVSTNVHDPFAVPLATVVGAVRAAAGPLGASVSAAELVGLAPAAALEGFPSDVELRGFDERRHVLDKRMPAWHV